MGCEDAGMLRVEEWAAVVVCMILMKLVQMLFDDEFFFCKSAPNFGVTTISSLSLSLHSSGREKDSLDRYPAF